MSGMTLDEVIKHAEEVAKEKESEAQDLECSKLDWKYEAECAEEHRQLAEWLKDYKRLKEQEPILNKLRAEIKEWYWQADKQELAKDPCVVDAMIDLFIRTIDKYKAESED